MTLKDYIIHKSIKYDMPAAIQEEVKEKVGGYSCVILFNGWIDLFVTLEYRDYRRRAVFEAQNPATKNNMSEQPDGSDANSESSPKVF